MLQRYSIWIFLITVIITWPCLLLDRPFDADHAIHVAKILSLEKAVLNGEGIFHWSHQWFGGYPANINYPFAAYFVIIGIRWLSLGFLSLDSAYALGVLLAVFFYGWAVYVLASRVMPRYMAAAAACFSLLDGGDWCAGGYFWEIKLGVWPCKFGVALCLLSLFFYLEALNHNEFHRYIKASIVLATALFVHPISLIFVGLVGPPLFCFILINQLSNRSELKINFRYLTLSLILAILASLFWTGPLLLGSPIAEALGAKWMDFSAASSKFFRSDLFHNIVPPTSYLLVWGTLFSFLFNRGLTRFFAFLGLLLIILATRDVSTATLAAMSPKIDKFVEFPRFIFLAKPFLFIAATAALHSWLCLLNRILGRNLHLPLCVLCLMVLVMASTIWSWPDFRRKSQWTTEWLSDNPESSTLTKVQDWLCSLPVSTNHFFRVAFLLQNTVPSLEESHWLYNLNHKCAIPLFKLGFTPATAFRYMYGDIAKEDLQRFAIKYLMTDTPQEHANLRFFKQFDDLYIYEVVGFHGSSTIVSGSAKISLLRWDQKLIEYDVTESKNAILEIPLTDIGYWKVSQNSRTIETRSPAQANQSGAVYLVQVPVENGILRLEYKPPYLLLISSMFGLLVWISMIFSFQTNFNIGIKQLVTRTEKLLS